MNDNDVQNRIAVIGMSGRFPGAKNLTELWDVLKEGRETISHFSKEELASHEYDVAGTLERANYVRARGVLEGIELFDAPFFSFNPKEATLTDPHQRIWLELAWEALEQAGYSHTNYDGDIGVFTGHVNNSYLLHNLLRNREDIENYVRGRYNDDFLLAINNANTYLATKTSFKLDLRGPAVSAQTACSTSLLSVAMAVQSLLQYESDICIAGGISISVPQQTGYFYQEGAIVSRDGHCRPFDIDSCGTVFGSGGGAVVLKRLEDALAERDHVLAVIRGAAINNDGANKVAFTAPSVDGQARAIKTAHFLGDVPPETISYVEAHGTATPMGDPIEIAGLTQAFGECGGRRQFCGIGSIKSNIGHMDAAAGIAGLIKTVLALYHRTIPATIHFKAPNPDIHFEDTPFYVVDKLTEWSSEDGPLRAGVSSFGVGGTNAHVVLQEAPPRSIISAPSRKHQLVLLSAKTETARGRMVANLAEACQSNPELDMADIAWTLHKRRRAFPKRLFAVCDNNVTDGARTLLDRIDSMVGVGEKIGDASEIAFAFPGQGAHHFGMAEQLSEGEPVFRNALSACCEVANRHIDFDLAELFTRRISNERYVEAMAHNGIAQLAIFAIDYSLAQLWMSLGIRPDALLGHSLGEWPAVCVAEILSLEQAVEAVWHRGRLMQSVAGGGAAITVFTDVQTLEPHLDDTAHIAAINAPKLTLVSGPKEAILACQERLDTVGISYRTLDINVAVHSPALDEIVAPFEEILRGFTFAKPTLPIVSTATGAWLTDDQATDPAHWANQMRSPVQFASAIDALFHAGDYTVLEVGPGVALSALTRRNHAAKRPIVSSLGNETDIDEHKRFLRAVGNLWVNGIEIDADVYWNDETRSVVHLPTYSFDRKRYWVEPPDPSTVRAGAGLPSISETLIVEEIQEDDASGSGPLRTVEYVAPGSDEEKLLATIWSSVLGVSPIGVHDTFRDLGGDSFAAVSIMERILKATGKSFPLRTLNTAPDIERFAKLITLPESEQRRSKCLVPIRTGGTLPPVYWLPGGGGLSVMAFQEISERLDANQPVYGLEANLDIATAPTNVPDIVREFREEIQAFQPHGPYYLLGYSFGAFIAYELAVQLRRLGEEIGILVVFDADVPSTVNASDKIRILAHQAQGRIKKHMKNDADRIEAQEELKRLLRKFSRNLPILSALNKNNSSEQASSPYQTIIEQNLAATQEYAKQPLPAFDGKVTCILARSSSLHGIDSAIDPRLGWKHTATKGVEFFHADGNHLSMIEQPDVEVLAPILRECLSRAYEQSSN